MAKELYLYLPIYDFVAQELIAQIEENTGSDITLRENTPGGSVFAAYGIYKKITEHGNVHLKVDGSAMSGGAFLPLYTKSSECLDVSRFVFHRADMYVEDEADQEYLDGINKDLKAKMKMKIDSKVFKEVTGFSIEDMFDPTKRIDITLSGTDAKKIGLIDKVVKLTPQMQSELTAFSKRFSVAAEVKPEPIKTQKTMTLETLKAEHPAVYAEVLALGVAQEKDRVTACLVFNEIDPAGVKAAIEGGKPLSHTQMAEFTLKATTNKVLAAVKKDSKGNVTTEETEETVTSEKSKDVEAFEKSARKAVGLKN